MKESRSEDDGAQRFISPLRFRWLTPFYDQVLRFTLPEEQFKRELVDEVALAPGLRVLDLGCGTGTLTVLLKQAEPEAIVVGLDPDADALLIAQRKARSSRVDIEFQEGLAWDESLPPGSFDRVVSSLVFHHLPRDDKRRALLRAHQLLKPDGTLHIADWGKARGPLMRLAFLSVQLLDGFETTQDSVAGRLPGQIEEAGFVDVVETQHRSTLYGTLSLIRAHRGPSSQASRTAEMTR